MKKLDPADKIEQAQALLTALTEQVHGPPEKLVALIEDASQTVATMLEELQVTEEELRQQNEELIEARAGLELERLRYHDLFEHAPDAYLVTDADGLILEANTKAEEMLGPLAEHLVRKPLINFVPVQDRKHFRDFLAHLLAAGEVREQEVEFKPRQREVFPASVTARVVHDPEGGVLGLRWLLHDITDRVTAEHALRASEEKYRTLLENLQEGVWQTEDDRRMTFVSQRLADMLGYSVEELTGRDAADFMDEDGRADLERLQEARRRGDEAAHPLRFRRRDGSLLPILTIGTPVLAPDGTYTTTGSLMDISELAAVQNALQQSEEKYRFLVDNLPQSLWQTDADRRITFANQAYADLVGTTVDELLKHTPQDFLDPRDSHLAPEITAAQLRGEPTTTALRVARLDGTTREILHVSNPLFNADGSYAGTVASAVDLTPLREAEAALRASEEKYRTLIENMNEGVWMANLEGRLTFINPAMARLLGYTPEEMLGRPYQDFMPPEQWEPSARRFEDRKRGFSGQYEFQLLHRDGRQPYMLVSGAPVAAPDGTIVGSLGVFTDITDRHAAELALAESEELFRGMFEASPIGKILYDTEGVLTHVNQAALAIYGMPSAEALEGFNMFTRGLVTDEQGQQLRAGQPLQAQVDVDFDDVQARSLFPTTRTGLGHTEVQITPLAVPGQPPHGYLNQIQDITERRRAEAALRESETRYRTMVESIQEGLWLTDANAVTTFANEPLASMLGYTPKDMIGQPVAKFHFPEDTAALAGRLADRRRGLVEHREQRLRHRDGHPVFTVVAAAPILAPDGTLTGTLSTLADITERKVAAEELFRTSEMLTGVTDNAPAGIILYDPQGIVRFWSPGAARMTGWSAEEALGQPIPFIPKSRQKEFKGLLRQLLAEGGVTEQEVVREKKDGSRLDLSFSAAPVHDREGQVTGIVSVFTDITERQQMEAERERLLGFIEEESERFFSVLNMLPGYVCLLTPDHHFRFVNKRFIDLFGDPGEQTCFAALFGRDEPCEGCQSFECLQTGESSVWEWDSPLGTVFEVHDHLFTDADGTRLVLEFGVDITDRKHAEQALAQEHALLEAVLDQTPVGLIVAEAPSGRFLFTNERMRVLWHEEAFRATSVQEYAEYPRFYPGGKPMPMEGMPLWRSLAAGEVVTEEEHDFIRADGVPGTFSANSAPVHDAEGHIVAAVVALTDVTERKAAERDLAHYRTQLEHMVAERTTQLTSAEAALREEHDFIETVVDTVGALIVVLDPEGNIIRFNRACEELTGYAADEVLGQPFWQFLLPEEADQVSAVFRQLLNNLANENENYWTMRDGTPRLISWRNTVLLDQEGLVEYIVSTGLDVTARRAAEAAVRAAGAYNRRLLEASLDPLVTIAPDGRITDVNAATERATGIPREGLIGTDFSDYFTDPEAARASYEQVFREGQATDYPLELVDRTGAITPVLYNASVYRDDSGAVVGVFAAARDVSERTAAEAAIAAYQEALRALASELALAEEHERRRIAVGIHDHISQSLALSKLKLGLLRDSCPPEAAPAITDLTGLTDEVIGYTRSLTFELSPPVLYELGLEAGLEWLCHQAPERYGFACAFFDDLEPKPLAEDTRAMLFVGTRELLANAAKHAQASQASVAVSREGNFVRIDYADDGVGFDPALLQDSATRGSGFGLFNLRERLEFLGGQLEVQSAPGAGTRILLLAPLSAEE
jgi:PAS domain S-box-containing protein